MALLPASLRDGDCGAARHACLQPVSPLADLITVEQGDAMIYKVSPADSQREREYECTV